MPWTTVNLAPDLDDVAAVYASRKWDLRTYHRAWSDYTPDDIDRCVWNVQDGIWDAFHVLQGGHVLAAHHLHDRNAELKTTWVSGFIHKDARGRDEWYTRCQLWDAAQKAIRIEKGFSRIFCYCLVANKPGNQWVHDICKYYVAGLRYNAVPNEGRMDDILVYSLHQRDIEECRRQADELFEGSWETEPRQESMTYQERVADTIGPFPPME